MKEENKLRIGASRGENHTIKIILDLMLDIKQNFFLAQLKTLMFKFKA
jgi:hypothetical protein